MDFTTIDCELIRILDGYWSNAPDCFGGHLYSPYLPQSDPMSMTAAFAVLHTSTIEAPAALLPLTEIDQASMSCLVLDEVDERGLRLHKGQVVRWHTRIKQPEFQAEVIDTGPEEYLSSLCIEHGEAWNRGYQGIIEEGEKYRKKFIEQDRRPKAYDLRPFQLACQNVIIGLAAFQFDPQINSLAVPYWLTCDVPHVRTNEGNRALSIAMLCDAFQSGGTMELSFDRHPEGGIPASLSRYARTLGLTLGAEIGPSRISPTEARELFWKVTPLPDELRGRCEGLIDNGVCSVERICHTVLSPIWKAPALDFLLACADNATVRSILEGGASSSSLREHLAEREILRSALIFNMLHDRLDNVGLEDTSGDTDGRRLFEDTHRGVRWHIDGRLGTATLYLDAETRIPWTDDDRHVSAFTVIPRSRPIPEDGKLARKLNRSGGVPAFVVIANDADERNLDGAPCMRCPVRSDELDLSVSHALNSARLGRI